MSLGENICRLRTERAMSQGDLAEALDVSRQSVSKWETGGAVPELDKLVKLSALFGVTLDELVTGEKPEPLQTPPPPGQGAVEPRGMPGRQVAGIVLLCMGFALTLALALQGGLLAGLVFSSPLWVCGIICLAARRHPGLWCLWAVFSLVCLYLRYATGISWGDVRWTLQWTPKMNYARLATAWGQFLCALALLAGTVWRPGREPLVKTEKNRRLFWGGWALFVLLCLPISTWIFQAGGLGAAWLTRLTGCLQDLLRLALLAGLFTCLRRWRQPAGS